MKKVSSYVFEDILDDAIHCVRSNVNESVVRYSMADGTNDNLWSELMDAMYEFLDNLKKREE